MFGIKTPELQRLNCALFGTFEGLDIKNYLDANDIISKVGKFLNDESIVIGTQRKYYGQLYHKLDSIVEFPEDINKIYKNKYAEIDKLYYQQIKERNVGKPLVNDIEMASIIANINNCIITTTHQSIKIIGYFFLCIDYNQSDMLMMRFKDFLATTIDPDLNSHNYLDLHTGVWKVNDFSFTISTSFCSFVKEQHGIKSRTNFKWLVGQNKTFLPYNGNNTSTLSNVFTKSFSIKFNDLIDKFRHHSMWLDENLVCTEPEPEPEPAPVPVECQSTLASTQYLSISNENTEMAHHTPKIEHNLKLKLKIKPYPAKAPAMAQ